MAVRGWGTMVGGTDGSGRGGMLVLRRAVALVAMAGLVAVAGCSSGKVKSGSGKDGKPGSPGPGQVALEVTGPAEGATNVPVTAEIVVKVTNGKIDQVG